jgi:hypothetical protein
MVSLGYTTIYVCRPNELEQHQVGYSLDPDSKSLTGENEGDWLKSWLVIGHEDLTGDPFFIETCRPHYPVYTAVHGEGQWDPVMVADSLQGFRQALSAVAKIAAGRQYPLALEANPLTQQEREDTSPSFVVRIRQQTWDSGRSCSGDGADGSRNLAQAPNANKAPQKIGADEDFRKKCLTEKWPSVTFVIPQS